MEAAKRLERCNESMVIRLIDHDRMDRTARILAASRVCACFALNMSGSAAMTAFAGTTLRPKALRTDHIVNVSASLRTHVKHLHPQQMLAEAVSQDTAMLPICSVSTGHRVRT